MLTSTTKIVTTTITVATVIKPQTILGPRLSPHTTLITLHELLLNPTSLGHLPVSAFPKYSSQLLIHLSLKNITFCFQPQPHLKQ